MPFLDAWQKLGPIEGEYSNNPNDRGGPTRWGMTEAVMRKHQYKGEMRYLPIELARKIAKYEYWDTMNLDLVEPVSKAVAWEMFEAGFNMGTGVSARFLQRSLNALNFRRRGDVTQLFEDLKVDGWIGDKTIDALRAHLDYRKTSGEAVLLRVQNALQGERYLAITESRPNQREFFYGWTLNRVTID